MDLVGECEVECRFFRGGRDNGWVETTGDDDIGVEIASGRNEDPDETGVDDGIGICRGRPRGWSSSFACDGGAGAAWGAGTVVRAGRDFPG